MSVQILNKKGKAVEVDASRCKTFGDVKMHLAAAKKMVRVYFHFMRPFR